MSEQETVQTAQARIIAAQESVIERLRNEAKRRESGYEVFLGDLDAMAYSLCQTIEKLPASPENTNLSCKAGQLAHKINYELNRKVYAN